MSFLVETSRMFSLRLEAVYVVAWIASTSASPGSSSSANPHGLLHEPHGHALCLDGVRSIGVGYFGAGFPEAEGLGRLPGCCPLSCGDSCGGAGCDALPGGAEQCCVAAFAHRLCDYGHDTHCLVPPPRDSRSSGGVLDAAPDRSSGNTFDAVPTDRSGGAGFEQARQDRSACGARPAPHERFLFPVFGADCSSPRR